MSQDFKNPFLEGSEEVPRDEAAAAAKELAEEAKKTRLGVTATPAPTQKNPAQAVLPKTAAQAPFSPATSTPTPVTAQASAAVASSAIATNTPITSSLHPPTNIGLASQLKTISTTALVTDVIAASIAIALTLLLLQDVLPFLN